MSKNRSKRAERKAAKQAAQTLKTITKRKSVREFNDRTKRKILKRTTGILSEDITFFKEHAKEFAKLVKVNNQRIRRLENKGLLSESAAYQAISDEFKTESGRLKPLRAFKSENEQRKLIEIHLRFATSKSATAGAIAKSKQTRRQGMIDRLIEKADASTEDRKTLREFLESLSDDDFNNIISAYDWILSKQFAMDSNQKFIAISHDIVQKARMMHEADTNQIMHQVKVSQLRHELQSIDELKTMNLELATYEELSKIKNQYEAERGAGIKEAMERTDLKRKEIRNKRKATFTAKDLKELLG